ncbi:hypothetical protein N7G274_008515 [Stereocaulon virgatum]|uniref:PEBP-like protein n=1 Tax=Stereocaulon virgatum TaxID=373712 RepID=A0ABR3ZYI5_9LECA
MVLRTSLFTLTLALLPALALTATPPTQQQHPPPPPPPPLYTATLHHLPVTTSPPTETPQPHATPPYYPHHPHLSTLTSFTPPPNSSDPNSLTQIVIYLPNKDTSSRRLRTSATTTYAFHAPYRGRFRIVVDPATGDIVGATWHAYLLPLSSSEPLSESKLNLAHKGKGAANGEEAGTRGRGKGDFDIVPVARAPEVVYEK